MKSRNRNVREREEIALLIRALREARDTYNYETGALETRARLTSILAGELDLEIEFSDLTGGRQ